MIVSASGQPELPFRGSDAVRAGRVTKGMLRGPRYRRVFPDVYVDARTALTPAIRAHAAFLLVERRGGVLAGYSAAELLGASCGPIDAPAEVVVPDHIAAHAGLTVRQDRLRSGDVVLTRRIAMTSPLRTAWDLARRLELVEAIVAVDALAHPCRRGLPLRFEPAELLDRRAIEPRARGARTLDRVVELAAPLADSPMETRMRVMLVLAGLPAPFVQYPLRDERGALVALFDLAYPEARLAIEYDGLGHEDPLDRSRDLRTGRLGWHTMRLQARDILRTPQRTVELVRNQIARRLHPTA